MRRTVTALITVLSLAAAAAHADSGKIHVCRGPGSTSTVKSVDIPAGSSFAVADSAHHIVKTASVAKLGAKCASIDATSATDPEGQPIKQGKTPITAQFSLPGITLDGTVSRTFKPSAGAAPAAKAPAPAAPAPSTPTAVPAKATRASPAAAAPAKPASATAGTAPTVADAAAPAGSTAKCKDGTYSKSQHHSGTCSHHGGVAEWLTQ
jgi:Protein of unknown function (DUF3761)